MSRSTCIVIQIQWESIVLYSDATTFRPIQMSQLKLDCNTDEIYWTDVNTRYNTDDSVWLPAAHRCTIPSPCIATIATMHLHYIAMMHPTKQNTWHQKSQSMVWLPNQGPMIFYIVFNQSMHCIVSTRARLVKMSPPFSNLLRPSITWGQ